MQTSVGSLVSCSLSTDESPAERSTVPGMARRGGCECIAFLAEVAVGSL